jgi:hypothetical protein
MSFSEKLILAGLVIALFSFSACQHKVGPGPGRLYGEQQGRVFPVSIDTDPNNPQQCSVDWPAVTLWKGKQQMIKWISDDGKAYLVDFTLGHRGSPFKETTFPVKPNGSILSGPPSDQSSGYYDYGIRAGNDNNGPVCKPASDPGVYVK